MLGQEGNAELGNNENRQYVKVIMSQSLLETVLRMWTTKNVDYCFLVAVAAQWLIGPAVAPYSHHHDHWDQCFYSDVLQWAWIITLVLKSVVVPRGSTTPAWCVREESNVWTRFTLVQHHRTAIPAFKGRVPQEQVRTCFFIEPYESACFHWLGLREQIS